jgi:hypothetical protein
VKEVRRNERYIEYTIWIGLLNVEAESEQTNAGRERRNVAKKNVGIETALVLSSL